MKLDRVFFGVVSFVAFATFPVFASAAEPGQRIVCYASGESPGQQGGQMMEASASFEFTVFKNSQGLRVLKNLKGEVITDPRHLEFDASWIGRFEIPELAENPDYRPRRYHGFSQFREVDATDTEGSAESGMWGVFLLEKDLSDEHIEAKYIFQASDHMGGTLHLGCHQVG
jgi:hypothetical protein